MTSFKLAYDYDLIITFVLDTIFKSKKLILQPLGRYAIFKYRIYSHISIWAGQIGSKNI